MKKTYRVQGSGRASRGSVTVKEEDTARVRYRRSLEFKRLCTVFLKPVEEINKNT